MGDIKRVGIIDYGTGNIASIFKAINSIGGSPFLISQKNQIKDCDCLIFPGVGHFGEAIKYLRKNPLFESLAYIFDSKIPILGICLGFQLLTQASDECPDEKGFGVLPFKTERIKILNQLNYKVPHIGWNSINPSKSKVSLLNNIEHKDQIFYFSNAYSIKYDNSLKLKVSSYTHESEWIAIAEYENIFGVQFHPEKSRGQGLQVIKNFLAKAGKS